MNWLKKIFLISAVFILSSILNISVAQGEININSSKCFRWIEVSTQACKKGSFYVYVNRRYNQENGFYYFDIYIWSNSYYENCNESSTYIDDVDIYINSGGRYVPAVNLDYYLAAPKTNSFNGWNYMAYVYSKDPNQLFKIKWSSVSTY